MSTGTRKSEYTDIDQVRDPDGVVAVISARDDGQQLAVAFFKEFDRRGETAKSAFLQRRHLAALERLLPIVRERMDSIEDQARARERSKRA